MGAVRAAERGVSRQCHPPDITARVSVEQAATFGWVRFTGLHGTRLGMRTFGVSAPLQEVQRKFGFTPENIAAAARELVGTDSGRTVSQRAEG